MKRIMIALACLVALSGCDSNQNENRNARVSVNEPTIQVTPVATNLGDNLNLQALGELVKTSKTAQEIEDKLNTSGSINNLDLDDNGQVDYIKVTEYGDGTTKGFSFTVDLAAGESQEIATVEIQKGDSQQASMNISGNEQVYGHNHYYTSHYSMSDLIIMSYLFSPHGFYRSPYHFGYYPSYYHSYGRVSAASYGGRVSSVTKTSTITKTTTKTSTVKSPNSQMSSKKVNTRSQSLANPTKSQKSFTKTSPSNSKPSTNGFGKKSSGSSSSSSKSSARSSSSGKSNFGSSSRSSGSRSSSSSSRSSSRRSDVRFKSNITPLTGSLDKICLLQGMSYDWNKNAFPTENFDNKKQIGFLAQDLEKVYPAVVNTRTDGYKTVDYDLLVPALVESIKELKAITVKQDSVIRVLLDNKLTVKK